MDGMGHIEPTQTDNAVQASSFLVDKYTANPQDGAEDLYQLLGALWKSKNPYPSRYSAPFALRENSLEALLKAWLLRNETALLNLTLANNKSSVPIAFFSWVKTQLDEPAISWGMLQKA